MSLWYYFPSDSSRKIAAAKAAAWKNLFFPEGLAVGALVHGGVGLVGAHHNPIQGAVVFVFAVISTLLYGAFDALVGMTVHTQSSFVVASGVVWPGGGKQKKKKEPILLFPGVCAMVNRKRLKIALV